MFFFLKKNNRGKCYSFTCNQKKICSYVEMGQLDDFQIKHLDQLSVKFSKVASYSLKMQSAVLRTVHHQDGRNLIKLVDPMGFPPLGESDFQTWFNIIYQNQVTWRHLHLIIWKLEHPQSLVTLKMLVLLADLDLSLIMKIRVWISKLWTWDRLSEGCS